MTVRFVGREREQARILRTLERGRNLAVSGKFGSGRTTLLRYTSKTCVDRFRFVFVDFSQPPRATWEALAHWASGARHHSKGKGKRVRIGYRTLRAQALRGAPDGPPAVVVLDNVERVTAARLDVVKRIRTAACYQLIAVLEGHLPDYERQALLRWLAPLDFLRLGPLPDSEVRKLVSEVARDLELAWSNDKVAAVASGTGGHPLALRLALERAAEEARA